MLDPVAIDYIEFVTPYLKYVRNWQLHFCVVPRSCYFTNKVMWMKWCYVGSREKVPYEKFYIDKDEFILWKLKT